MSWNAPLSESGRSILTALRRTGDERRGGEVDGRVAVSLAGMGELSLDDLVERTVAVAEGIPDRAD